MVNQGALVTAAVYSRRRGVSRSAVVKARRSGRLRECFVGVGGKTLVDPVVADREWSANTDPSRLRLTREGAARNGGDGPPPSGDRNSADAEANLEAIFDEDGLAILPELTGERLSVFLSHGQVVLCVGAAKGIDGLLWRMDPGLACWLGTRLLLLARKGGVDISFVWKRPLEAE